MPPTTAALDEIGDVLRRNRVRGVSVHDEPRQRRGLYACLLAVQAFGIGVVLWNAFPAYRHILVTPGHPSNTPGWEDFWAAFAMAVVQAAYWTRYLRVPVPVGRPRILLSHLLLFAGRISFIFGGALFSLVFFRHLPDMDALPGFGLLAVRTALLAGVLFSLFCFALELERLGVALRDPDRK